jgi:ribosomal protein L40E
MTAKSKTVIGPDGKQYRRCTACGKTKPITEFHQRGKYRASICRNCVALEYKAWCDKKGNTCVDCGTAISPRATRCRHCATVAWRREKREPPNRCIDCGAVISRVSTRCRSCAAIERGKSKNYREKLAAIQRLNWATGRNVGGTGRRHTPEAKAKMSAAYLLSKS